MFGLMGHAISSFPSKGATTMRMVICDPDIIDAFEAKREANGLDKYDEVWEGVPVIMSLPNDEHQEIVTRFSGFLQAIYNWQSPPHIRAGVNVSDRVDGWKENYREPDVAALQSGLEILRVTDLRGQIKQITQATLVFSGERDLLTPPAAQTWLAHTLPNARLQMIAGAAHAPFVSHADIFVQHTTDFMHE